MKIREIDSRKTLAFIESYKKMTNSELKTVKVRWAFGDNKKRILSNLEDYSFYSVDTKELIKKVDFGEMGLKKMNPYKLFTNVDASDYRIAKILKHWIGGGYIDPPILCFKSSNKFYIADGRHRTITAHHLGEKYIPVAIHKTFLKQISEIIYLKKIK